MAAWDVAISADAKEIGKPISRSYLDDYPPGICACTICRHKWKEDDMPGRLKRPRKVNDYRFRLLVLGAGHAVDAGCRDFTISEFRKHVAKNYPGTSKADATLAILKTFEERLREHRAKNKAPAKKAKAKK